MSVYIELDVLTGQIFGTTSEIGSSFTLRSESDPDDAYDGWTTVQPRQAWFSVSYPWVDLKLGQFAFDVHVLHPEDSVLYQRK